MNTVIVYFSIHKEYGRHFSLFICKCEHDQDDMMVVEDWEEYGVYVSLWDKKGYGVKKQRGRRGNCQGEVALSMMCFLRLG